MAIATRSSTARSRSRTTSAPELCPANSCAATIRSLAEIRVFRLKKTGAGTDPGARFASWTLDDRLASSVPHQTAVNIERLPGDVVGLRRREEQRHIGNFIRRICAPNW